MYNSKIYAILEQFDKYEQNRCRKYIQSPYFNRSEQLVQLYDRLVQEVNADKKSGLEKEALWEMLQPGKPYDDVRFRKYCSDLLKLIEGYLAQEALELSSIQKSILLMKSIDRKKINSVAGYIIKQTAKHANKYPHRSAEYFMYQYQREKLTYQLSEADIKRGERSNIEQISNNLDFFFIAEKLKFYCSALMQRAYLKEEYKIDLIEEIINYVADNKSDLPPVISIYYQIFLLLTDSKNEDNYFSLLEVLSQYAHLFSREEAYNMYTAAMNYCIGKFNQGNARFIQELFEIYEELLKTKILILNGEISPWDFKNIVFVSLRLGRYEWTENFIHKYSGYLSASFRENAVTFNLARVYWYQKKHDEVIKLLRDVEYEDIAYALGSRALLLATYYETEEIEPLYSLMESFRAFLNRHKDIPEKRRRNYKNLIKFTKKLTKIRYGDKQAIDKLRKEIEESGGVADAKWLNEQIAELEGSTQAA